MENNKKIDMKNNKSQLQIRLFEMQDIKYGDFQAKLTPGIDRENIIGIRIPELRKFAKTYIKEDESKVFLSTLPHKYYDEYMLHGLLISEVKDFDECVKLVDVFLPYVDNWAVCDIMSPKIFKKHTDELLIKIEEWMASTHTYTIRFGMEMLMRYYLDDKFQEKYLDMVASVQSVEYYVNMMIAWYFATALAKQWDSTVKYIENNVLDKWVHNKSIQKARESYRITGEQKEYLKGFKR